VTEYSIFGMLLFRAFRGGSLEPRAWRWAWSSLLVLVLFAAMDEIHQTLEPERSGSVVDVFIDAAGGIVALSICLWWFYRQQARGRGR
jgi:VanZ family protein